MEAREFNIIAQSCKTAAQADLAKDRLLALSANELSVGKATYLLGAGLDGAEYAKELLDRAIYLMKDDIIKAAIDLANVEIKSAEIDIKTYAKEL